MPKKKQPATAVDDQKKHSAPLQEKLKHKDWDPIKEIIEITDEYEEGTPKREAGKDYWGACCLESQDVDVSQPVKRVASTLKNREAVLDVARKPTQERKKPQARPMPK
jgi:hypothetical protein